MMSSVIAGALAAAFILRITRGSAAVVKVYGPWQAAKVCPVIRREERESRSVGRVK